MSVLSDVVIEYEKEYFPVEKPAVAEIIADGMSEKGLTQKELVSQIGVSQSRISEFFSGKSEPSLKVARSLCLALDIKPSAMMGL